MSQICICVLMGLPASGKTSFVHKLKEVHNNDQIIYHICYDEILQFTRKEDELKLKRQQIVSFVEELVKKINDGLSERVSNMSDNKDQLHTSNQMKNINLYEDYQTKANHMIENLGKNIVNGRENDFISDNILIGEHVKHLIIIDDNMYYKSMRYSYFKISKANELSFCIIHFHVDLEESLESNRKRTEERFLIPNAGSSKIDNFNCIETIYPVTNDVIINMTNKLEPPANEGFEKNHFIIINPNGNNVMNMTKYFIDESFKTSVTKDELPNLKVPYEESFLQICDLVLRKIVSSHIEKFRKSNKTSQTLEKTFSTLDLAKTKNLPMRIYGEHVAAIKKMVLKDIQNGNIHLKSSEIGDSSRISDILNEAFDAYLKKS
uniref:L-seryl-tRNA(Sec) kinase n=1 Tax=Cacopsylla melanoneura TaxID=428564 RepID=A0A8D8QRE7_9HEMI